MADVKHVPQPDREPEHLLFHVIGASSSREVLNAPGLPRLNDTHPLEHEYEVVRVSCRELNATRKFWAVDIEYSKRAN